MEKDSIVIIDPDVPLEDGCIAAVRLRNRRTLIRRFTDKGNPILLTAEKADIPPELILKKEKVVQGTTQY